MAVEEPVLVVPRKFTQSAFAILVREGCVARPYHQEGRYGSRTFTFDKERTGLPLLPVAASRLKALPTNAPKDVTELLSQQGVEIVQAVVPLPRFVAKRNLQELPDATIHLERKRVDELPLKQTVVQTTTLAISTPSFTYVDLFCGIGGFAIALERLGGRCLMASDIDLTCRELYLRNVNLSEEKFYGDIFKVPDHAFPPNFDILVAGFPCQPFSSLGQQPGLEDSTRGLLYTQIIRVLLVAKPKCFLLENVQGLINTAKALETIVAALENAGYQVTVEVCSSRGLTAQSRKRLFFVGLRADQTGGEFSFPFIPDLGLRAIDILDYGNGGNDENKELNDDVYAAYRVTDSQLDQLSRSKRWKPAHMAWPDTVCDTLDGHYGVTIGKGNSQLVPGAAPRYPRTFTARECARLMGFPSSFVIPSDPKPGQGWRAHLKKQYLMFGNAVCPPLIAVLAGAVLARCSALEGRGPYKDWGVWGLLVGLNLSLDSLIVSRQEAVQSRLQKMGILE